MNLFEATLVRDVGYSIQAGSQTLDLDPEAVSAHPAVVRYEGRRLIVGIRPEALEDAALAQSAPPGSRLRGTVELTEALGSEVLVHLTIDAAPAVTEDVRELARDVGDERMVSDLDHGGLGRTALVGRFGARSRVRAGETVEVAVDTRALHFFDPETGLGVHDR
jgi:multiple sugar transport system ATP-binding protein